MRRELIALTLLASSIGSSTVAAELKVIIATPLQGVVEELAPVFQRSSGHAISPTFVSGPIVKTRIDAGDPCDVAVSITPVIDGLIKDGKLTRASRLDVAYAPLAVGVRAGAAKPDVSTVDAFRQALLNARSVAHSATGASGEHFLKVRRQLGIEEAMKPKLRPMPADRIAQAVPNGEAEMIVVTRSVVMVPGVDVVGLIPDAVQFYNSFAGAVAAQTNEPAAASGFLQFLAASLPVLRTHGLEPGAPKH